MLHVGVGITLQGQIVGEALGNHCVDLCLVEPEGVLDGVTPRLDGVPPAFTPIDVTPGLVAKPMGLVDQCLKRKRRPRMVEHVSASPAVLKE